MEKKKIKTNKLIGSAVIDLTSSNEFINPMEMGYKFSPDSLYWFIIRSSEVFKFEPYINKYFKHAFRIAWIYPFMLDSDKPAREIYIIIGSYLGKAYFFNKNPIREKHIWKDVEWGKRKKNYNILGKDPGTVWIKTIDDGKAKTIGHQMIRPRELLERIKLSSIKDSDHALLYIGNNIKIHNEDEIYHI